MLFFIFISFFFLRLLHLPAVWHFFRYFYTVAYISAFFLVPFLPLFPTSLPRKSHSVRLLFNVIYIFKIFRIYYLHDDSNSDIHGITPSYYRLSTSERKIPAEYERGERI